MKTTKRSKMLLSSIAMLLVALVALGSASFAWYISQASVTAEESSAAAIAAEGLVIRHTTDDDWGTSVTDLETATDLNPATCSYANIASNVRAAGGTGTDWADGTLTNTLTEQTTALTNGKVGDFLYDSFYVASSSGTVTATLTLDASTVAGTYMNYLIFVGGTLRGVYTSDSTANLTTQKVTSTTGQTVTTGGSQSLTALNDNVVASDISVTPKTGNGVKIEILAFADGFNAKCTNQYANTSDVPVSYTITKN